MSALEVIDEKLTVGKGHKVPHGGAGGIGTLGSACQASGAATSDALGETAKYAKELGADKVIDSQEPLKKS